MVASLMAGVALWRLGGFPFPYAHDFLPGIPSGTRPGLELLADALPVGFGVGFALGWVGTAFPHVVRRAFQWKYWSRVVYGLAGCAAALLVMSVLAQWGVYRLPFALDVFPAVLTGFWTSLELVGVILSTGFALGFAIGWARTTRSRVLRVLGAVYVDFFRSMPPLGLIFFFSLITAIELKSTSLDPFALRTTILWAGAGALALHTAAYQAEIVRAGILSVPTGQTEAADSVGLSRLRAMFVVVLPQAFRVSLPALGNEFSSSIKDTSLLSVIGWAELSYAGSIIAAEAVRPPYFYFYGALVGWIEVALLYFVLTYVVTRTVRGVEDLFRVPGLEAARL